MSRTLATLSLVGMIAIAWQLSGQETKPRKKPAPKQSPAVTYQTAKRSAELHILEALNRPISVEFQETPLNDVVEFFGKKLEVPIIVDEVAVSDEGIALDEPVTFQVKDVAARSALDTILDRLELTCLIQDEVLEITSAVAAEEYMVTIVYDVSDLVELSRPEPTPGYGGGGFGGGSGGGMGGGGNKSGNGQNESSNQQKQTNPYSGGGFFNVDDKTTDKKKKQIGDQAPKRTTTGGGFSGGCITNWGSNQYGQSNPTQPKKVLNFAQLIEVIQRGTWGPWEDIMGVGGTISEYEHEQTKRELLVIRQSQKIHREIEEILVGLRAANKQTKRKNNSPVVEYRKRTREAEQKILKALNKSVAVKFKDTPLKDVVQFFGEKLSIQVLLNENAISDEGLAIDEPITFVSKKISARSALNIILDRLDLTWIVHREMLYITSTNDEEERQATRVYDVSNVINLAKEKEYKPRPYQGGFSGNPGYSPQWQGGFGGGGYFQIFDEADDPKTIKGGHGTIKPFDPVQGEPLLTKRAAKKAKKKLVPDFDPLIELIQNETTGHWEDIEGVGGRIEKFEHVDDKRYYLVIRQRFHMHLEIEDLLRDMKQRSH